MPESRQIPYEVWGKVFEALVLSGLEDGPCGRLVTPLLRVCKEWMAVVMPFVFRHIYITKKSSLEGLTGRLLSKIPHTSENPGSWTWTLTIRLPESHINCLSLLLLRMPNLYTYELIGPWVQIADLSPLENILAHKLKKFANNATRIDSDQFILSSHLALCILSSLSALRELHLDARNLKKIIDQPSSTSYNEVIEFPSLTTLVFGARDIYDLRSLNWFHFPMLENLCLQMQAQSARGVESKSMRIIQGFLSNHSHVNKISLALPCAWLQSLLQENWIIASHLELLELENYGIPDIVNLPRIFTLTTLTIQINLTPSQSFWDFLQILLSAPTLRLRSLHIRLWSQQSDTLKFTWGCGSQSVDHATFVGNLLSRAMEFRKLGIAVYDQNDKTYY